MPDGGARGAAVSVTPSSARRVEGPPAALGDAQRPRRRPRTRGPRVQLPRRQGIAGVGAGRRVDSSARALLAVTPGETAVECGDVGWSFGASVALREALDDARVSALALVGIPLRPGDVEMPPLPDRTDLRLFARPAMLLAGEHDQYAPPEDLRAYGALFPQAEVVVVPGTDHYFWRREREAASVVGAFADGVLNRP